MRHAVYFGLVCIIIPLTETKSQEAATSPQVEILNHRLDPTLFAWD